MKATLKISFDVITGDFPKEIFESLIDEWKANIVFHATEGIENNNFGDLTIEEIKNLKVGDPKIEK